MAKKKKTVEPVIEEQDIIVTPIPGYEDRYGITDDHIVYDVQGECALTPVLDDLGRPCVKLSRELIPIADIIEQIKPKKTEKVLTNNYKGYTYVRNGRHFDTIEDIMEYEHASLNTVCGKIKLGIYTKG